MLCTVLKDARQNNPGESGITLLLTLGIAAPYFQQEILQDLNLTDWENLRLTNKRHDMIMKPLRARVMARCKSRRYQRRLNSGWSLWVARWPLTGIGGRDILDMPVALEEMQWIPSLACTVSWPHDNVEIQPCIKLRGWLKDKTFAGPCSEIVCRKCADRSAHVMRAGISALMEKRMKMVMCQACQIHEMSRYPHGFRSCICEDSVKPVEGGGWRCHNCLTTAIYVLLERATTKLNALEYLYRNSEGEIWWDIEADRAGQARPVKYPAWPCPGCLTRLPNFLWWHPTVQFCAACDGIIVKATCGEGWEPSMLAPSQPLLPSDPLMTPSTKESPLTYAALDSKILTHKQGLNKSKTSEVEDL